MAAARAAADAQQAAGGARAARVLEIGTGTGCVAICTAAALRGQKRGAEPGTQAPPVEVQVVATDVVPAALDLAQANARTHQVESCITWLAGSLYQPLLAAGVEQGSFDVLVSNPPYVSAKEFEELPQNVRGFEPRSALWGGADGMDVVRPLVASAHVWLKPGGLLAVEVGHHQHDLALAAARANAQLTPRCTRITKASGACSRRGRRRIAVLRLLAERLLALPFCCGLAHFLHQLLRLEGLEQEAVQALLAAAHDGVVGVVPKAGHQDDDLRALEAACWCGRPRCCASACARR